MSLPQLVREDDDRLEIETFRRPTPVLAFKAKARPLTVDDKMKVIGRHDPKWAMLMRRIIAAYYRYYTLKR